MTTVAFLLRSRLRKKRLAESAPAASESAGDVVSLGTRSDGFTCGGGGRGSAGPATTQYPCMWGRGEESRAQANAELGWSRSS